MLNYLKHLKITAFYYTKNDKDLNFIILYLKLLSITHHFINYKLTFLTQKITKSDSEFNILLNRE